MWGDLSRSVAPNHVRRYATLVVIISKRATSHSTRLGTRARLGRQALRATLKGQGDWRRSRPPEPRSFSGQKGLSVLDWWRVGEA
jgi:hypothetical protein